MNESTYPERGSQFNAVYDDVVDIIKDFGDHTSLGQTLNMYVQRYGYEGFGWFVAQLKSMAEERFTADVLKAMENPQWMVTYRPLQTMRRAHARLMKVKEVEKKWKRFISLNCVYLESLPPR